MLTRLLALCLMIVFAGPAMAFPCAEPGQQAGGQIVGQTVDQTDCHDAASDETPPASAVHHMGQCVCILHQTSSAAPETGEAGVMIFDGLTLAMAATGPMLHGLAVPPLSPPPNFLVS